MSDRRMAASWTFGYVDDVVYTLGFHRELAPSFLAYACLAAGVEGPLATRPWRYCELGCGRGYAAALLAAANPDMSFVGIDFNPAHIAEARALADRSNLSNVRFLDISFGDAAHSADPDLGSFDIVVLHGVYSWVSAEVREDIHEFLRNKLSSGGIAFVSYNALPGWNRIVPTQKLLIEAAGRASGDSIARVRSGMGLLDSLIEKSDGMVARHGALSAAYLKQLARKDPHYLAHEFLNGSWQPLFVTEAIERLAGAKLTYVGSAAVAENRVELCVPKDLRETVRSAPDVAMRELLKDFVVGKQFRRDIYVKGPRPLSPERQRKALDETMFAHLPHVASIPDTLKVPVGELSPKRRVADAMWQCLERGPASGADLRDAAVAAGEHEAAVWPLIEILVQNSVIHPLRLGLGTPDREPSHRLNTAIIALAASGDTHRYLASPLLGSAIPSSRPERLFPMLAVESPGADDLILANKAFDRVEAGGEVFMREGHPVEKSEETARSLAGFLREFRERRLPRWRMLGVVD